MLFLMKQVKHHSFFKSIFTKYNSFSVILTFWKIDSRFSFFSTKKKKNYHNYSGLYY